MYTLYRCILHVFTHVMYTNIPYTHTPNILIYHTLCTVCGCLPPPPQHDDGLHLRHIQEPVDM